MILKYLCGDELQSRPRDAAPHQPAERSPVRKVDVRLPGKGNSNSHGARPVHLIITMIKWFRTSGLSIKNSLSADLHSGSGIGSQNLVTKITTQLSLASDIKVFVWYRGTSLKRNCHPHRTTVGP